MTLRLPDRPLPLALLIGVVAQALFCWRLTTPHIVVFDEIHYVTAARWLIDLTGPRNIEHPLLGKMLIAAGIAVFGDGPLGWRIGSTFAGTGVVLGVFWILWLLFGRTRTAVTGGVLTILNFTVFVQARIAMLDGYMAAFVVLGVATMLWSMRGGPAQARRRWIGGAVLLGLAVATKWTAVPYVAGAAWAFVVLKRGDATRWPGLGWFPALATLGVASGAVYLASFAPAFFYAREPMTWARLIPFQLEMYAQQTQVLPVHAYQSRWWSWAFDARPIWYLYERVDGAQRGILLLGNPAVLWGGIVAVAAALYGGLRERNARLGAVALLWLGSYLVWAVIPKSLGFFYYYYLPSIWLSVVLAAVFDQWREDLRGWDEAFLVLCGGLFLWFYPVLSAAGLSGPGAFQRWMWFSSWR